MQKYHPDKVAPSLQDFGGIGRTHLRPATRKAAKVFSGMEGETVIDKSEDLRRIASTAAQIHGWDRNVNQGGPFNAVSLSMVCGPVAIDVSDRQDNNETPSLPQ